MLFKGKNGKELTNKTEIWKEVEKYCTDFYTNKTLKANIKIKKQMIQYRTWILDHIPKEISNALRKFMNNRVVGQNCIIHGMLKQEDDIN